MRRNFGPQIAWLVLVSLLGSTCASFTFSQNAGAQSNLKIEVTDCGFPLISKYATDLTERALAGKLETKRESEGDVTRVIKSLAESSKDPVIVGASALDRDAIARGLAMKIALGDVPDSLRSKHVFRLRIDSLAKGANSSEEFVSRVLAVFTEAAQAADKVILFVDQLHEYAGVRATSAASAILKHAIEA